MSYEYVLFSNASLEAHQREVNAYAAKGFKLKTAYAVFNYEQYANNSGDTKIKHVAVMEKSDEQTTENLRNTNVRIAGHTVADKCIQHND